MTVFSDFEINRAFFCQNERVKGEFEYSSSSNLLALLELIALIFFYYFFFFQQRTV